MAALGAAMLAGLSPAMPQAGSDAGPPLPEKLRGPFIARPDVIQRLDHLDPGGDCDKSGKLVFACLIQALAKKSEQEAHQGRCRTRSTCALPATSRRRSPPTSPSSTTAARMATAPR